MYGYGIPGREYIPGFQKVYLITLMTSALLTHDTIHARKCINLSRKSMFCCGPLKSLFNCFIIIVSSSDSLFNVSLTWQLDQSMLRWHYRTNRSAIALVESTFSQRSQTNTFAQWVMAVFYRHQILADSTSRQPVNQTTSMQEPNTGCI